MGTPNYAIPVLDKLVRSGHDIAAVYTQPDRPAGRGRILTPTPIKSHATDLGLETVEARDFSDNSSSLAYMLSFGADAAVVAVTKTQGRVSCGNCNSSRLHRNGCNDHENR